LLCVNLVTHRFMPSVAIDGIGIDEKVASTNVAASSYGWGYQNPYSFILVQRAWGFV